MLKERVVIDKWIKWLDRDNPEQCAWAIDYFEERGVRVTGNGMNYENAVATIKAFLNKADRSLFMRGMRIAWSQRKYREGLKVRQAGTYNHVMTKLVRKQLEGIAKSRKCTLNAALGWCIEEGAKEVKEEKKQLADLQKKHNHERDSLCKKLAGSETRLKGLEARCAQLEYQLNESKGISLEEVAQLPALRNERDSLKNQLERLNSQSELWVRRASEWEILAKAHNLHEQTLNPHQREQVELLIEARLSDIKKD